MKFFKLLIIFLSLSLSLSVVANITKNICSQPEINGSLLHTNLIAVLFKGGSLSECALYYQKKSIGSVTSVRDCPEINCRAASSEKIILKAKTVLKLTEKAKGNLSEFNKKEINKVNKGEENIHEVIKEWQKFLDLPNNNSSYNYGDAEKYLSASLELLTNKQVDLLPRHFINTYLEEERVKAEKKRKEAEIKRLEQQRKKREADSIKRVKKEQERIENMTCIWTLTFDQYFLFLPFRHSNCIWVKLGIPSPIWFLFNIFLIYLIYKVLSYGPKKSKKYSHLEVQEINDEQKEVEDSFFSKKDIN